MAADRWSEQVLVKVLSQAARKKHMNRFFNGWAWAPGVAQLTFQLEMTLPTMTAFLDAGKPGAVVH